MHIAILTFEGFNELDSLIAFGVLSRIKKLGWRVTLSKITTKVAGKQSNIAIRTSPSS